MENYRVPQCSNQYVVRRFSKSRRSVQQYMIVVNRRRNRHRESLQCCQCCAEKGSDKWGKTSFQGNPRIDLDIEIFYAVAVTTGVVPYFDYYFLAPGRVSRHHCCKFQGKSVDSLPGPRNPVWTQPACYHSSEKLYKQMFDRSSNSKLILFRRKQSSNLRNWDSF